MNEFTVRGIFSSSSFAFCDIYVVWITFYPSFFRRMCASAILHRQQALNQQAIQLFDDSVFGFNWIFN